MDFEWFKEIFEKAYIYVPTICAFITSIGIPALVSIAKIVSNAKTYLQSAKTLKQVVDVVTNVCQSLIDTILLDYENQLKELELEKAITHNKKALELLEMKEGRINNCIQKYQSMTMKELIDKALAIELNKGKKKKVKVKVVKKAE